MQINSQLPLIYDASQRSAVPVDSSVNQPPPPSTAEASDRQVPPVILAENIQRARDYTLKAQSTHQEPLNQLSKEAISAYGSHDKNDERDYLSQLLGLDTFA
jgi:hypothetical protein